MASAIDDAEGIVSIGLLLGIAFLFFWGLKKFGIFGGASSPAGSSGGGTAAFNAPTVNGVTGVAAGLQRGIAGLVGATPAQVFGPTATGPGSNSWWDNFWSWLLPWGRPYDGGLTSGATSNSFGSASASSLAGTGVQDQLLTETIPYVPLNWSGLENLNPSSFLVTQNVPGGS